jgi:hypothetical protein
MVYHAYGAHAIYVPWAQRLNTLFEQDKFDPTRLPHLAELGCECDFLLSTMPLDSAGPTPPPAPIVGCAVTAGGRAQRE